MFKISCSKEYYSMDVNDKFLFLKSVFQTDEECSRNSDRFEWRCLDSNLYCIDSEEYGNVHSEKLILAFPFEIEEEKNDTIFFYADEINLNSKDDWRYLLHNCITRNQNGETDFQFLYILWALENCFWNYHRLVEVLQEYPQEVLIPLIDLFQKSTRFLSY